MSRTEPGTAAKKHEGASLSAKERDRIARYAQLAGEHAPEGADTRAVCAVVVEACREGRHPKHIWKRHSADSECGGVER